MHLTFSYKLWYNYLKLRRQHARRMCPGSLIYEETNNAHERALVTMHKVITETILILF